MAITKLMHIKQGKKGKSRHLYNSIFYVLNPEKTENGLLVGGNTGVEANEVYRTMLDTKEDWEKPEGRQGYHFVLSFKPGETDEQTAYQVLKEFCQEYLADQYDYVFAIHNDHDHLHGHIMFNSVNRMTGYKYRYEKGDWEKYIQPITDKICMAHGLESLEFDNEKRRGCSYAQWNAEKKGKVVWKKIIRADIDAAVALAENEKSFLERMKEMGYEVRKGNSGTHGTYLTFRARGQTRGWRSYNLGEGYGYETLLQRIYQEESFRYDVPYPKSIQNFTMGKTIRNSSITSFQKRYVRTWYVLMSHRHFAMNPYMVNQKQIRKSLLHIDRMREDINYLLRRNIKSYEELLAREQALRQKEKACNNQKYSTEFLQEDDTYQEYQHLQKQLRKISEWDDRFEELQDRMEFLEALLPDQLPQSIRQEEEAKTAEHLEQIRAEKRIIRHIRKLEKEDALVKTSWARTSEKQTSQRQHVNTTKKKKGELNKWVKR